MNLFFGTNSQQTQLDFFVFCREDRQRIESKSGALKVRPTENFGGHIRSPGSNW